MLTVAREAKKKKINYIVHKTEVTRKEVRVESENKLLSCCHLQKTMKFSEDSMLGDEKSLELSGTICFDRKSSIQNKLIFY